MHVQALLYRWGSCVVKSLITSPGLGSVGHSTAAHHWSLLWKRLPCQLLLTSGMQDPTRHLQGGEVSFPPQLAAERQMAQQRQTRSGEGGDRSQIAPHGPHLWAAQLPTASPWLDSFSEASMTVWGLGRHPDKFILHKRAVCCVTKSSRRF